LEHLLGLCVHVIWTIDEIFPEKEKIFDQNIFFVLHFLGRRGIYRVFLGKPIAFAV
jgi:hypothetical protein